MPGLNPFLMHEVELPLIPVVADLEDTGYLINADHFHTLRERLEAERTEVLRAIRAVDGAGPEFNPDSPKQVRVLLFEALQLPVVKRTPKGDPSTDEAVLLALRDQDTHGIIQRLLRHRALTKGVGTYCSIPDKVGADGRLHVEFRQIGAETGRFTSRSVIQTLPKDEDFGLRKGFVAPPGKRIVAADYVQQELYVLAAVSQDPNLLQAIRDKIDLHGLAAVKVFGLACEPNQVKKLHKVERDRVKAIQFGIIYGRSADALASELGLSREDAQQLMDDYFAQFGGVHGFIHDAHDRVVRDGCIDDLFGRRRYLPDARRQRPRKDYASMTADEKAVVDKIGAAKRAAQNFLIQGPSATITKLAMLRCHQRLKEGYPDAHMLLTMHDELQFEVPEAQVAAFAAELPALMCDLGLERFDFHVALEVEVKVGPSWGALQSYAVEEPVGA